MKRKPSLAFIRFFLACGATLGPAVLAALLMTSARVSAQTTAVSELTADTLLERVTVGVKSFAQAAKECEADQAAAERGRASLVAALDSLNAPLPPEPESVAALVAWPAEYGESGIMTFIVNQQGRVYRKDLGPTTENVVGRMKAYDPDMTWSVSPD